MSLFPSMWFLCALWLLPLVTVLAQDDFNMVSEVLFCQPQSPDSGLLKMFNEEQMFSYNFKDEKSIPRLDEFAKWANQSFPNPANISNDRHLCKMFLAELTEVLEHITPEAKGTTTVTLLTAHPVFLGKPNTLICFVSNIYPPILSITWQKEGVEVTEGISYSGYFAMPDLTYQTFSYLNITPHKDDKYACVVRGVGDNTTAVGFWVPTNSVPSHLLENVLCGLGIALGILLLFLGLFFFYLTCKGQKTE